MRRDLILIKEVGPAKTRDLQPWASAGSALIGGPRLLTWTPVCPPARRESLQGESWCISTTVGLKGRHVQTSLGFLLQSVPNLRRKTTPPTADIGREPSRLDRRDISSTHLSAIYFSFGASNCIRPSTPSSRLTPQPTIVAPHNHTLQWYVAIHHKTPYRDAFRYLTRWFAQAQTPRQRQANDKFLKDQEARRGKSEDQIKLKKTKEVVKSPISPVWLGKTPPTLTALHERHG